MTPNFNSPVVAPRAPVWVTPLAAASPENTALTAAFAAGAGLAALDAVVRTQTPWTGVWRRRLALKAAASLPRRREDAAALRDALAFTKPGDDPGPAGRVYLAWRALVLDGRLADVAAALGPPRLDLAGLAALIDAHARSRAPAPLAAAAAAKAAFAWRAEVLPFAIADLVLATRLGWRAPLPLLAAEIGRVKPDEPAWVATCCSAYARAAVAACELNAEIAAAAARLLAVAPKLRARGADAAIAALLDDDALASAADIPGLSDRGLRRLFDRLVALGAIRELSGRATFRLYGL